MEERTTVESPPVEKLMSERGPGGDDHATREVASVNGPPWAQGAPTQLGGEPQHASIDSDEDEPTVEASHRQLRQARDGTMDEPTIDRQDEPVPGHSRGSGRRPPYQQPPPAALGPAWAKLVVTAGNDNGREFPLSGKPITVGRALDNDVVLSDIAVSRKHLSLAFDGRRYLVIDHASGNGTMINDRLETGTCLLTHGDRLELGNTMFRFEHPASRGLAPAQPQGNGFEDDEVRTVVGKSKSKRNIAPLPPPSPGPQAPPQPIVQSQHRLPIPAGPDPADSPQGSAPQSDPSFRRGGLAAPLPGPASHGHSHGHSQGAAPAVPGELLEGSPGSSIDPLRMPTAAPQPEHLSSAQVQALPDLLGGAQHQSDPSMRHHAIPAQIPPEALLATSPISRFAPFAQPRSSRRGLILVLLLTILGVGGAIAFVTVRGGWPLKNGDETAAAAANEDGDEGDEVATAPLPRATWGTDETPMLASIGVTEVAPGDDADDADDADGAGDSDDPDDQAQVQDPADSADPDQVDPQATDTAPPETEQGLTPGDDGQGDDAQGDDAQGDDDQTAGDPGPDDRNRKRTTRTTKPVRRATRVDRPNTAAARKRALAQYRNKEFDDAAHILRSTASEAGGKEAGELRSLASGYEKVGAAMSKGNAAFVRDPISALDAYRTALNLDKRYGEGTHSSFIRSKLSVVAPKAAASFMAKDKYEAAKSAADTAASTGAGSTPMVQRVRQGLERQAGEFYKSSLRMKNEPKQAEKLLKRILDMVPPSSPWYSKAYKRLNTR